MANTQTGHPQVITANRLNDGIVVYLTADAGWSRVIADSLLCSDDSAVTAALVTAEQAVADRRVVDPYAIEVSPGAAIRPVRYREEIRAFGPSVAYGPADQPDATGQE